MVEAAAVIGRSFSGGARCASWRRGDDRAELDERLAALVRKQLIEPRRRARFAGEPTFSFSHILVRDVAYQGILKGQRVRAARALRRPGSSARPASAPASTRRSSATTSSGTPLPGRARPARRARPRAGQPRGGAARVVGRPRAGARRHRGRGRACSSAPCRCSPRTTPARATSPSSSASRWPSPASSPAPTPCSTTASRPSAAAAPTSSSTTPTGKQQVVTLDDGRSTVRSAAAVENDIALIWDQEVSRQHARCCAAEGLDARRRRLAQRLLPERPARQPSGTRCATATCCASATRSCCSGRPRRASAAGVARARPGHLHGGSPAAGTGADNGDVAGNSASPSSRRAPRPSARPAVPALPRRPGPASGSSRSSAT